MTIDERTIILDLMQKNGFEAIDSLSSDLRFQKIENYQSVRVFLSNDFPFYVETRYTSTELPEEWVAKQTFMLKSFDKAKGFAENEINAVIDNLKMEFNNKLRGGNGAEI